MKGCPTFTVVLLTNRNIMIPERGALPTGELCTVKKHHHKKEIEEVQLEIVIEESNSVLIVRQVETKTIFKGKKKTPKTKFFSASSRTKVSSVPKTSSKHAATSVRSTTASPVLSSTSLSSHFASVSMLGSSLLSSKSLSSTSSLPVAS